MNKLLKTLIVLAAFAGVTIPAGAQRMGELTEAVLRAYKETLEQDPQDYITYYRRGLQYFMLGRYDDALADVNEALKYTPAKDADMMQQEYSLLSDILRRKDDLQGAMKAINQSLTINPKSYADIYRKGNLYLEMKDGEEAYRTFKSLLNLRSRSQEAMFGMAKASVLLGNKQEARQLIDEARDNDATNPMTFIHIGDVEQLMGEDEKAVTSYLAALSLTNDITRPVESLEDVALKNYPAYNSGFDYAIAQSGEARSTLEYIRAVVDYNTGHYRDAYNIMNALKGNGDNVSAPFLTRLARASLMLNKIDEARINADAALALEPLAEAYLVKAETDLAMGQPANALISATKANDPSDPDFDAMLTIAKAQIAMGDAGKATDTLNELILIDGENIPALLLRGYVKKHLQKDDKGAKADFERASKINTREMPDMAYKAIAQTLSGKTMDGESTINAALGLDNSADALALAAVYYAQTGNETKAQEYKQRAMAAGCENQYLINSDKTPYLSLTPTK